MPADAARTLLGVAPDADGEAIRAAHRRLIARVHPDAGGSLALAAQVNAARDTLLAELNQDGRQAS
jgi:curved DNA-binding protein CbpA